jgi:HKD family nuclease
MPLGIMLAVTTLIFLVVPSLAFATCDFDDLIGYTLVTTKYVAGYIEKGERKDAFEGCNFGRILIFDDNTGITCMSYLYSYSYHPKAYIFMNGTSMKACINDNMYSVGPIR